jgi:hypothetical protein
MIRFVLRQHQYTDAKQTKSQFEQSLQANILRFILKKIFKFLIYLQLHQLLQLHK